MPLKEIKLNNFFFSVSKQNRVRSEFASLHPLPARDMYKGVQNEVIINSTEHRKYQKEGKND